MRKIFKKVISAVASMAMLAGMVVGVPSIEAKAAAKTVTIHVKVADATNYGVNIWGENQTVTDGGSRVNTWDDGHGGWQTHPSLKEDSVAGWGKATITADKLDGMQIVKEGNALLADGQNNIWNNEIFSQNLSDAYFDSTTGKWYKEVSCTNEILPPTLDDIYYVYGDEGLVGANWAATDAKGLMTESNGVFSKKYDNIAAGTYHFKILQDPADFGNTNNFHEGEGTDDGFGGRNSEVVVSVANSSVTISINKTTKVVTTVVTAPSGETQATTTSATAATTTSSTATTQATTTADPSFVAKDIKVKVKLDAAVTWDKVYLYSWNGGDKMSGDWPGTEATKEGDYYVITINAKTKYVNMIANNGSGEQTIDIENIDCSGDEVVLNVSGEKNSDGKYVGTSPAQKTTTSGDTTPFVAIVAVLAMLGCAFVALNSKKARR